MSPYSKGLYLVILISLLLSLSYCPLLPLHFDDNDIFKYISRLLLKGLTPYVDVLDNKPPLIYFFNLSYAIAGDWGLWIFDSSLVLAASVMFYRLNYYYRLTLPFLLPILFNLLLRNYFISFGIAATREYTTVFMLMGFCILLGKSQYKAYLSGVILGLIFFTQQEQIVIFLPILLYGLLSRQFSGKPNLLRGLTLSISGFLTVAAPLTIYFAVKNALPDFWKSAFLFNFQFYLNKASKPGLLKELIVFKEFIYTIRIDAPVILAIVLAVASLIVGNSKKYLLIISLPLIPLSFFPEFLSSALSIGYAKANYYLLPLSATLPMVLFLVFAFTKPRRFNNKLYMSVFGVLMLFGIILFHLEYLFNYYRYHTREIITRYNVELEWLSRKKLAQYDLYIVNNSNAIYYYNKLDLVAPSPWVYHFFWKWYKDWDMGSNKLKSIIVQLELHHTKYIHYHPFESKLVPAENILCWESYLKTHFQKLENMELWQRTE